MSPTGTAPSARSAHTAVLTATGDGFFIFGGDSGSSRDLGYFCVISGGCWVGASSLRERKRRGIFKNDLHFYNVQVGEDGIPSFAKKRAKTGQIEQWIADVE